MRYWINTISLPHVRIGVEGGFTQADHGENTRLKRLEEGDLIAFYSPRTEFRGGEPLQAFTAIGRLADAEPYQVEMTPEFHPWRRWVEFLESEAAPIRPLIEKLDFIRNKQQWGYPFRRGLFEVKRADFERIAGAMNVELEKASQSVATKRWVNPV
ncbi:MAG: EVE domain-containing protein [Longimicrobiaceae bacterium]